MPQARSGMVGRAKLQWRMQRAASAATLVRLVSTWYGKRGRQFCGSHRTAWEHDRNDGDAAQGERKKRAFVSEMDVLLGSR